MPASRIQRYTQLESQRVSDGHDAFVESYYARVTQSKSWEPGNGDTEKSDVVASVLPGRAIVDDGRFRAPSILKPYLYVGGSLDYVVVGEYVAVGADDES